jgi:hypothetical protein
MYFYILSKLLMSLVLFRQVCSNGVRRNAELELLICMPSFLIFYIFRASDIYIDNYTIIIRTKCTWSLLLKSQDITICNFVLYFCPYIFQPAWVIFRGLNTSAWLKLFWLQFIKITLKWLKDCCYMSRGLKYVRAKIQYKITDCNILWF